MTNPVTSVWSVCRVCDLDIRLLDRAWHHVHASDHTAEPDLIPRAGSRGLVVTIVPLEVSR